MKWIKERFSPLDYFVLMVALLLNILLNDSPLIGFAGFAVGYGGSLIFFVALGWSKKNSERVDRHV